VLSIEGEDAMTTTERSGWVGWAAFAGTIMIINGAFSVLEGMVALIGPNTYYVVENGELFLLDVTGFGWGNIIIGALLILTAVALLNGATWARVIAIILVMLSAIAHLLLVPAQPWWSIIVIAIDVLVIYALTAHGRELRKPE
jgi:hypothetical protein